MISYRSPQTGCSLSSTLQSILLPHYNSTLRSTILCLVLHFHRRRIHYHCRHRHYHRHTKVFHISTIISTMTSTYTTTRNIPAPVSSVVYIRCQRQRHHHQGDHTTIMLFLLPLCQFVHINSTSSINSVAVCLGKSRRVLHSSQWMLSHEVQGCNFKKEYKRYNRIHFQQ